MKRVALLIISMLLVSITFGQSFADLVEKVNKSVVTIYVLEQKNPGYGDPFTQTSNEGLGSGVLVGEKGIWVLTAAHVVSNASKILVEFQDGRKVTALTKRVSHTADVALIQLDQPVTDIEPAVMGNSDDVRIGEEVFIIGAPLGLSHSVSKGIISGRHSEKKITKELNSMEFFQTDAAINQGNSGGPMFNMKGEVIGIVSSILSFSGGFEGLGFAATTKIAQDMLLQRGSIWLGIDALPLSMDLCKVFNVSQEGALLVQSVAENSAAYFMGIKGGFVKMGLGDTEFLAGGDIILSLDHIALDGMAKIEELRTYLNNVEPRHQYVVKVLRAGEEKELKWRMDN
jgi:S1-C subfamily serine protease